LLSKVANNVRYQGLNILSTNILEQFDCGGTEQVVLLLVSVEHVKQWRKGIVLDNVLEVEIVF
jgi:hypothetical protein